jgi:hypothetical protein
MRRFFLWLRKTMARFGRVRIETPTTQLDSVAVRKILDCAMECFEPGTLLDNEKWSSWVDGVMVTLQEYKAAILSERLGDDPLIVGLSVQGREELREYLCSLLPDTLRTYNLSTLQLARMAVVAGRKHRIVL